VLIGILSDTHGRVDAARVAVELLHSRGAGQLIHCGDVGAAAIIDLLSCASAPASAFVWGNNDLDRDELASYAKSVHVRCLGDHGTIDCAGKRIAVTHGDDSALLRRILADERPDYLLTGHTHVAHDRRQGPTRWINPGALHRAHIKTVALLDTDTDVLTVLPVLG
jgi:uncharacterized protein